MEYICGSIFKPFVNRKRLLVGLSRLSEANALVGTMQEELLALGPKIVEKAKVSQSIIDSVARKGIIALLKQRI